MARLLFDHTTGTAEPDHTTGTAEPDVPSVVVPTRLVLRTSA
jgi:hypothetical protein